MRNKVTKLFALGFSLMLLTQTMCSPVFAAGTSKTTLTKDQQARFEKASLPEGVLFRIPADEIPAWAAYRGYECVKTYFDNKDYYYYTVTYQDPNNLKTDKVIKEGTKNATEGSGKSFVEGFFEGEDVSFKDRIKSGFKSAGKNVVKNIAANSVEATVDSMQEEQAGLNKDREFYCCKTTEKYPIVCYKTVPVKNNSNFIVNVTNGYTKIGTSEKVAKTNKGDRYRYKISDKSRIDLFTGTTIKNKLNEDVYPSYFYIIVEGADSHNAEVKKIMNEIFGFNFK